MDKKIEMFSDDQLWIDNIQKSINKGIPPVILSPYTNGEVRAALIRCIEAGEYRVAPPHIAEIPKDNGKVRKVFVNMPLDRLILGCINDVYYTLYKDKIHPNCLSYQKGISVHNILQKVIKQNKHFLGKHEAIGYKVDIHAYFDSVSREVVNTALDELSTGSPLDQVLRDYYNTDIVIDENDQVIEHYKSLAQGCAFGTLLANYVLRDVDSEISKMVPVYYRYSDDILIIGKDKEAALARLLEMLKEKGLEVNPKKLEPIYSDTWFTFLGFRINGDKISFSKKSLDNLQKEMMEIIDSSKSVKKAIKRINDKLYFSYERDHKVFGWAEYFFRTVNIKEDIKVVDFWIRDALRAKETGKRKIGGLGVSNCKQKGILRGTGKNVTSNRKKTEHLLEDNGYVSMSMLYDLYNIDRNVYKAYLKGVENYE